MHWGSWWDSGFELIQDAAPALLVLLGALLTILTATWVNRREMQREHRIRLYTDLADNVRGSAVRIRDGVVSLPHIDGVQLKMELDAFEEHMRRLYRAAVLAGPAYLTWADRLVAKAIPLATTRNSISGPQLDLADRNLVAAFASAYLNSIDDFRAWLLEDFTRPWWRRQPDAPGGDAG